jgi:hypothetical protein
MASLNETAHFSRIAIKYGAIALVVMIVGRFLLGIAGDVYKKMFPEAPEPPTVGFGVIPDIIFPGLNSGDYSYQLETPTGTLPQFQDRMEVFPYILERPNLLALEQAIEEADQMGFDLEPQQISADSYLWRVNDEVPGSMEMNVQDGTFLMEFDWTKAPDFLVEQTLINETNAKQRIENFLQSPGLLPADLSDAPYTVTYLKAAGRSFEKTVSLSEADFVRFDLFRKPITDLFPVMTLDANTGVVETIVSTNPSKAWLIFLKYNYFPVDYERVETYPIKTTNLAWEELLAGKGSVAKIDPGIETVIVRSVELGYFEAFDKQPYLQPIYIFRGDNNFVAYIQAVRPPTLSPTPLPK